MSDGLLGAHRSVERIHFVGIGGIGMSGIAQILARAGYSVSGSDLSSSPALEELSRLGVRTEVGHRPSNLGDAQAVVYSSAISADNAELQEAGRRKIPLVHRSEMLAEIMRFKTGIAISGTHGKTTTTAMTAAVLLEAGCDPTVVVGARVPALGSNARLGEGPYFVAEADESDRSFLRLPGLCNVATNIDLDHMDVYRDWDDLSDAFFQFLGQVPFHGLAVGCGDDPRLSRLLDQVSRPTLRYGAAEDADLRACDIRLEGAGSSYQCRLRGTLLGRVQLKVPGRHNVLNSLAAAAAGLWLNIPFNVVARALGRYGGAERRLQWKGEAAGVAVVDDYAHHPTEIAATLEALALQGRPVIAVYQPHRYTRTASLMGKMNRCFDKARKLYLLDIYGAGEAPIAGVSSQRLAAEISRHRSAERVASHDEMVEILKREAVAGDVILTLGAGDVWKIGERFLEENVP